MVWNVKFRNTYYETEMTQATAMFMLHEPCPLFVIVIYYLQVHREPRHLFWMCICKQKFSNCCCRNAILVQSKHFRSIACTKPLPPLQSTSLVSKLTDIQKSTDPLVYLLVITCVHSYVPAITCVLSCVPAIHHTNQSFWCCYFNCSVVTPKDLGI